MSTNDWRHRLDPDLVEQLRHGDLGGSERTHQRLAVLLAAARAPGHRAELTGERAALTAFQDAYREPVGVSRGPIRGFARLLTVKLGLVCAVLLGLGGVAVAASTGSLPGPLHLGSQAAGAKAGSPRASAVPQSAGPSRSRAASVLADCRRYLAGDRDHRARMLTDPDLRDLVTLAGSDDRDAVDQLCARLLHRTAPRPSTVPSGHSDGRQVPPDARLTPGPSWPGH